MGIKKLFIILILISLVLLPATPALAQEVTAESVTDQLMCQCGCDLVLSACNCELPNGAVEMKAIISEQLAQGESQQEILNFFFARYGAQVLASPKQNSNPMLWISALTGILVVGALIYLTRKKRARGK